MRLYHFQNESKNDVFVFAESDEDMENYLIVDDLREARYKLVGKYQLTHMEKSTAEIEAKDVDFSDGL